MTIQVIRVKHVAVLDAPALRALAAEIESRATEGDFKNARWKLAPPEVAELMLNDGRGDADALRKVAAELEGMIDGTTVADLPKRPEAKLPRYVLIATIVGKWGVGVLQDE